MSKKDEKAARFHLEKAEEFLKKEDFLAFQKEIEASKKFIANLEDLPEDFLKFCVQALNEEKFKKDKQELLDKIEKIILKIPNEDEGKGERETKLLLIMKDLVNKGKTSEIIDENLSKKSLKKIEKDLREYFSDFFTLKNSDKKNKSGQYFFFELEKGSLKENIKEFFSEDYKEIIRLFTNLQRDEDDENYQETLKNIIEKDKEIFTYLGDYFENLNNEKVKKNLKILKEILENDNFAKIEYFENDKFKTYSKLRCIKLIYSDNNWYLAVELDKEIKLLKLSFMKKVENAGKARTFQKKVLQAYNEKLAKMQNSQTDFSKMEENTALIKAKANIGFYFEDGMKKFFPSQKYIKTNEDGSVDFVLSYSQPSEVLPFIKRWLPSLEIISSKNDELEKLLNADIEIALAALEEL